MLTQFTSGVASISGQSGDVLLQVSPGGIIDDAVTAIVVFTPRIVAAIIILLIGWGIGRVVARVVAEVADRVELDKAVLKTPLGDLLGGTEKAISKAFGTLAAWFVYAVAILTAADVLAIDTLSVWVAEAVSYLPALIGGLLIIVLGLVVGDFVGDVIERTEAVTDTRYTEWFALGARLIFYFTAIVIGLGTMGVETDILLVFAQAVAYGLGAALAIGLGVAIGWGGKDYVAANIDSWMGSATPSSEPAPMADGGERHGAETDER
jgi:hypothetical protein